MGVEGHQLALLIKAYIHVNLAHDVALPIYSFMGRFSPPGLLLFRLPRMFSGDTGRIHPGDIALTSRVV